MKSPILPFIKGLVLALLSLLVLSTATAQDRIDNYQTWNLADYEAAGNSIAAFNEAPALAEQVAAGTLPPVEERLPMREDILVVQPRDQIGSYGGEITFNATNPTSFGNTGFTAWDQQLMGYSTNWEVIFPQIAKSIEMADDLLSATVTLRQGMKWSDGAPFTADDIMFWYESIMLHPELPNLPGQLRPGGDPIMIEKIDDYTVRFSFTVTHPAFPLSVVRDAPGFPMAPRHYLEKWHIDFNEDANALAEEEGFNSWIDAFIFHYDGQTGQNDFDPDMPVLKPWKLASIDEFGNKFYERNPYYWKVDVEGNQLPYIDSQVRLIVAEPEVVKLQVQAGEIDYGFYNLEVTDLPVLRAGEESGGYTTLLWPAAQGAMNKYQFNITVNDPVLNEVFNDLRFRQAMSLAVNREEINETLFFGLAVPRQWGVPSSSVFYEDWMGGHFAEYDPDQANALLDEMGLERGSDGVRLRPDGEPLTVVLWDAINRQPMSELVAEYWQAVGIDVNINPSTREAFQQALLSNEVHASVWFADLVAEKDLYQRPIWLRPPYGIDTTPVGGGLAWRQWWLSGGSEGEEPSDPYFTEQMELVDQWQLTELGSAEYLEQGTEVVTRTVEQMYHIGTVGEAPEIFIRANRLQNFPPDEGTIYLNHLVSGHSDQWFVSE
ncbi:MAG: ABC transporter substrate-binding protein [Deinococcota bacterium]